MKVYASGSHFAAGAIDDFHNAATDARFIARRESVTAMETSCTNAAYIVGVAASASSLIDGRL